MVRSELVRKIAEAHPHLSPLDVEAVVKAILNAIIDRLADGHRVELRGFGNFVSKVRDARISQNPRNGTPVPVAAKQVPLFKASKRLLERLNSKG